MITGVKIEELEVNVDRTSNYFDEEFYTWLCAQEKLKTLVFHGVALTYFLRRMLNSNLITFRLKKLVVNVDCMKNAQNFEHFYNFVQNQTELEEFVLDTTSQDSYGGSSVSWTRIICHIFTNCRNLRRLEFHGKIGFKLDTLRNVVLDNLETLAFKSNINFPHAALLRLCPNLKELDCNWRTCYFPRTHLRDFLADISNFCPRLEKLTIKRSYLDSVENYENLNLPQLKELSLECSSIGYENWRSITTKCPNVEKLHLELFAFSQNSLQLIVRQWRSLRELTLGCGVYDPELLQPLLHSQQLRKVTVSETMCNQFMELLQTAEFDVIVQRAQLVIRDNYTIHAISSFKSEHIRLMQFQGYLDNFPEYGIRN